MRALRHIDRSLRDHVPLSYSCEMSMPVWSGMKAADTRLTAAQAAM
jgi:hypothetical protein